MYNTILADPPWIQKSGRALGNYQIKDGKQIFSDAESSSPRELPYPGMTVEQISSLNIVPLVAKNAHLYLWVTNKYLLQAEQVINAWGFNYSTTLVWCKNPLGGGLGGNYKVSTEFLIFATKGSLKAKKSITGTWFQQKRPYVNGYPLFSKKPTFFHELIESVSPGPYLELFARNQRSGWDVFGDQVENSIIIQ